MPLIQEFSGFGVAVTEMECNRVVEDRGVFNLGVHRSLVELVKTKDVGYQPLHGLVPDAGVVALKQNYAEESQIVVAYVNGETTLKRFYKNDEQRLVELRPENDQYKTIYASDCVILGVAVKIIKDIK